MYIMEMEQIFASSVNSVNNKILLPKIVFHVFGGEMIRPADRNGVSTVRGGEGTCCGYNY